ncbi:MAG: RNA 2',3'-cyclic phosphodiesterase [Acholeplasmataceae bacterium]|nr:RNA 2',3'-cyclic phosphodiesterase [Acholeplasmataceae bacterium]
MRLFIGISLDLRVKQELVKLQEIWLQNSIKYHMTDDNNLHLTLKFLGEVNPSFIDEIMESLEDNLKEFSSFMIKIQGIGSFVRNQEHILWAGVTDGKEILNKLYKKVDSAIKSIPINTDQNNFKPHITLARRVIFKDDKPITLPLISIEQKITTVTLFHSHQVYGKLTYTPIESIVLND